MQHTVRQVAESFLAYGELLDVELYGSGHINDTFRATYDQGGTTVRYIHQRVNHSVFRDPVALMHNILGITSHIRRKLVEAGEKEVSRKTLTVIPTHDGQPYHRDEGNGFWRTYVFIERARTFDAVETTDQAFEAARAFGQFQKYLADYDGPPLTETIPDFHNTPKRFGVFQSILQEDVCDRAATCKDAVDFALNHGETAHVVTDLMARGEVPERITHNDTKFNNVMMDEETGRGICIVDLDTVMPGSVLYDFGDMVRTATSRAAEDERDLSKVEVEMPMFRALVRGYLETAGQFLNAKERELLAFASKLITFELGMRFLTDHLAGDTYFKIHRDNHNLDRARAQFKLVRSLEANEDEMNRIVEDLSA